MVNASDSGSRGRGSSPTWVKPCCVLEQGTFTLQKVLVIPSKWWLRPNMTEKLFTGTLRVNQPTIVLELRSSVNHMKQSILSNQIHLPCDLPSLHRSIF